ncbi:MAG: 2Fe-2S iron-sulfur cluster-binding protein [Acidobacteriota bacterium]
MSENIITKLEAYLAAFDEASWLDALQTLAPSIHKVDRDAVQVWFRFNSLGLFQYLESADDMEQAAKDVLLQGEFGLDHRVDSSHAFLYGHRYWNTVKAAIEAEAQVFDGSDVNLSDEIKQLAAMIAEKAKVDSSLLIGITAVGLMTLRQVGLGSFKVGSGDVSNPSGSMTKSPDAIAAARETDDSQGLLGFLKTINKKYSVIYDEPKSGKFEIMNDQEITSASGRDRSQDWQSKDERCWEGPVPVECAAASCGTCWVGVLGGKEKLSDVAPRESRAMKMFGYNQPDEAKPFIRLACQAKASGNVTIVIPPWNAVFGKKVYGNVEARELEPVTTSAKALREAVKNAVSNNE